MNHEQDSQSSEGKKFDEGKVRIELIPPEMLYAVGTILTFGANKYTIGWEFVWDELLSAQGVKQIVLTTAENFVVSATKNSSGKTTLNTPSVKGKIVEIGENKIKNGLRNSQSAGSMIQQCVNVIEEQSSWQDSPVMDSTKSGTTDYANKVVKYVDQRNTYTLTIVTTQGSLEVSFAANAITDSDFWTTVWQDLSEHLSISRPLSATGERNWELGMKWSRVFGAMMRHMWCWWGASEGTTKNFLFGSLDEETKYSHLWHAIACAAFLVTYEERQIGEDDRPF